MDVIYTDVNRIPKGVLNKYQISLDIGKDNNFEVQMNLQNHCMVHGSFWYVVDTEYGGVVDDIKINTDTGIVSYTGRSFRGILAKKIIQPGAGQDYYTVSGKVNDIIRSVINSVGLIDIFDVPVTSNTLNISYQFDRYTDCYSGLVKMLSLNGNRLKLSMLNTGKISIEAVPIEDLSRKYEYSDDYGMRIIFDDNQGGVNHLICLGQGELKDRQVLHLYVDRNGNISESQTYVGLDEIVETYDYSNVETLEELKTSGIEKLNELKSKKTASAEFGKLDVDVGDIVGGKNRLTGISLTESVSALEVSIKNGAITITYKIGDE